MSWTVQHTSQWNKKTSLRQGPFLEVNIFNKHVLSSFGNLKLYLPLFQKHVNQPQSKCLQLIYTRKHYLHWNAKHLEVIKNTVLFAKAIGDRYFSVLADVQTINLRISLNPGTLYLCCIQQNTSFMTVKKRNNWNNCTQLLWWFCPCAAPIEKHIQCCPISMLGCGLLSIS